MQKRTLLFILYIFLNAQAQSQNHDYFWIFGYQGGNQSPLDDEFANVILDFNQPNPMIVVRQDLNMNFHATCATMCDSAGNLLFYTNGEKIYNKNHTTMQNGGYINFDSGYGYSMPQGAIALPYPSHPNEYMIFHLDVLVWGGDAAGHNLKVTRVNMSQNNGLGKVVSSVLMIPDTLCGGQITATKHANGRDWWVLVGENDSKYMYQCYLSPQGINISKVAISTVPTIDGLGQSVFTPDGTKYIRANSVYTGEPFRVDIFDFDRCTGAFSQQRTKFLTYPGFGAYVSVSSNSKYLYVMRSDTALQFDLTAPDIFASETIVAVWDGFYSGAVYPSYFQEAQSGPDGRIYVTGPSSKHIHQINYPNRYGLGCDFRQHHIDLTVYNSYTVPNHPNYRLGPVDGSACDTLGFDNYPLCRWRWEQEDTLETLDITFTDLSAYEPATWHWDFGDGTMSQDTSPTHSYSAPGVYEVCLVVSNAFSSDTLCKLLNLSGVGTGVAWEETERVFTAMPNPANASLHVITDGIVGQYHISNMLGTVVLTGRLNEKANVFRYQPVKRWLAFHCHRRCG